MLAGSEVRVEEPKSRNGLRTLPLDDVLVALLKARQARERLAAGEAYERRGYVATWLLTSWAVPFTQSGTPMSSARHPDAQASGRSGSMSRGTRRAR